MSFIKNMAAKTIVAVLKMLFLALKKTQNVKKIVITADIGENNFLNCKLGLIDFQDKPKVINFEVENINFEELLKDK